MEKIRIKYFSDKIEKLTYIGGKSDWIDLRCAERTELKAGEFRLIPLGVAMALLAYSKFHGALVVLFALAVTPPRQLLRPSLYLSGAVALLLLFSLGYSLGWRSRQLPAAPASGETA